MRKTLFLSAVAAICALLAFGCKEPAPDVTPDDPQEQTDDTPEDNNPEEPADPWGEPGDQPLDDEGEEQPATDLEEAYARQDAGLTVKAFTEIDGDVVNPERGFYYPFDLSGDYNNITASTVKSQRKHLFQRIFAHSSFRKSQLTLK